MMVCCLKWAESVMAIHFCLRCVVLYLSARAAHSILDDAAHPEGDPCCSCVILVLPASTVLVSSTGAHSIFMMHSTHKIINCCRVRCWLSRPGSPTLMSACSVPMQQSSTLTGRACRVPLWAQCLALPACLASPLAAAGSGACLLLIMGSQHRAGHPLHRR